MRKVLATVAATVGAVTTAANAGSTPPSTTIMSGQVLNNGAPVAGATITMTAWPNAATLSTVPIGGAVTTVTIATATSDANGNYSLAPNLVALSNSYKEVSGTVNMEVDTSTASGTTQTWNLPGAVPGSPAAANTTQAVAQIRPARIVFDLRRHTITSRLGSVIKKQVVPTGGTAVRRAGGAVRPAGPPYEGGCDSWAGQGYWYANDEAFMNVWAISEAHAEVAETTGSSHTMGIALNIAKGGWGVAGSMSKETTSGAGGTLSYISPHRIYNAVNYRRYTRTCYHPYGSEVEERAQPSSFYDLLSKKAVIDVSTYPYCATPKYSGSYYKINGSNHSYSGGVSLGFISLESQASFSTDTKITWYPTGKMMLCGSTSIGWVDAPEAAARVYQSDPSYRPGVPC